MKKGKNICVDENKADSFLELDVDSGDQSEFESGDLLAGDIDTQLRKEKIELSQRLIELKRRREHPHEHIEGGTDVEDLFYHSDSLDESNFIQMVLPEDDPMDEPLQEKRKLPVSKGPTERAHGSKQYSKSACYVPSSDSGSDGDIRVEDDDGAVLGWALPSGRKSRANKGHLEFGEACKVTGKWVAQVCEKSMRMDTRTSIETVIETAKEKHRVEVGKVMAYRARKRALQVVLGDQIKQYIRLRDYLQTVIDTNPGSRCIVTTKQLVEHPIPNPRFHGMFYCINGTKEGFLNGCRPFIGLDGCFVKLTTGQEILAATGRDGNNNIYPFAFGLVDKEDTASWCWFLTQLKFALGGFDGKFGKYTIISDRQKVTHVLPCLTCCIF
uniref:Uncharacterized protein n=1 Tax=Avena sativa TaxID=4498 RepID=A0ACD5VYI4_AVESA